MMMTNLNRKNRSKRSGIHYHWIECLLWYHLRLVPFLKKYDFEIKVAFWWAGSSLLLFKVFHMAGWLAVLLGGPFLLGCGIVWVILLAILDGIQMSFDSRRQKQRHAQLHHDAFCPRCNGKLRTGLARQCRHCGFDWHDEPKNKLIFKA